MRKTRCPLGSQGAERNSQRWSEGVRAMEKRGEACLLPATHSGPRPADFPLGSLESRATVRALLTTQTSKTKRSQVDCLSTRVVSQDRSPKSCIGFPC